MKRFALGAVLVALMVTGCSSTPRAQFADIQDAYISTVTILLEAHAAGVITEEEWQNDVLPLIRVGDQALDVIDVATMAGFPADTSLDQVREIISRLRPFVLRYLSSDPEQSLGTTRTPEGDSNEPRVTCLNLV